MYRFHIFKKIGSWSIRQKNGFAELDLPNRHNAEMVLSIRQNLQNCYLLCSKLCSALSLNRKKTFKDQMLVLYYSRNTYNTYKNLDFSYKCPYSMHQISITSLRTQLTNTKKGLSIILNVPSTYHQTVLFRHFICSSVIKIK